MDGKETIHGHGWAVVERAMKMQEVINLISVPILIGTARRADAGAGCDPDAADLPLKREWGEAVLEGTAGARME